VPTLTELHLGRNKLRSLGGGLAPLRALRVLGVASNRLRTLDGVQPLGALAELYADHNGIDDAAALGGLVRLTTLELTANRLADLAPCRALGALEELWLADNALADMAALAPLHGLERLQARARREPPRAARLRMARARTPRPLTPPAIANAQTLRLHGCPLASAPGYREAVRAAFPPSLTQLDADPI
jgi:hypothetical protein